MKNGPYELVIPPADYPGMRYRGRYVYEHHLVWWKNTGELVTGSMLIHHRNGNKRDNRFRNLEKKERAKHTAEHNQERSGPPKFVAAICAWCDKPFEIPAKDWPSRRKHRHNHCSRSCSVKHQMQLARKV